MTFLGTAPIWETALHTQLKTVTGPQVVENGEALRTLAAIWWTVLSFPEGNDELFDRFATFLNNLRVDSEPALRSILYGWSKECQDTVKLASDSLPSDVVLTADMLPSPSGFFAFEPPVRTDPDSGLAWEAAICWKSDDVGAVFYFVFEAISKFKDDPDAEWDDVDFSLRPSPVWALAWPFSVSLSEIFDWLKADRSENPAADSDTTPAVDSSRFVKDCLWVIAAFIWLKQRIVVAEPQHIERHARKRIDREYGTAIERYVRVIQLRAMEPESDTAEGARHYKHRWIVSAHWRRQYYATSATHRLKFIAPHLKGPAGAPLKEPRRTVYEVNR